MMHGLFTIPAPPPKLSAPERATLREVFRHARKKGWTRVRDKDTVATWWDYDGGSAIQLERFGRDLVLDINGMTRLDVVNLKYAVDVLVAVGLLPVEMSSQYQAGAASLGELAEQDSELRYGWTIHYDDGDIQRIFTNNTDANEVRRSAESYLKDDGAVRVEVRSWREVTYWADLTTLVVFEREPEAKS